jgi:hypothetical protein
MNSKFYKSITVIFFIISTLMLTSCEKEQIEQLPLACFEADDTAELNQLITFTNCSDEKATFQYHIAWINL